MRAIARRATRDVEIATYTAWHVSAFARQEELEPLAPILARVRASATDGDVSETQTAEEQMAVMRGVGAALGAL